MGLGIRNVISKNGYWIKNGMNRLLIEGDRVGHGCFFVTDCGKLYSHNSKKDNAVQTDFYYGKGDVIRVGTNVDELVFFN